MKVASEAKVDYIIFDGAGGGTGMSPVPMMNEMGTPTIYLEAQVLKCIQILKKKGKYVLDITMAGGFINETQILKSIAMSNFGDGPSVKAINVARAPVTAAMKVSYFSELAEKGKLPREFSNEYGKKIEDAFITAPELKDRYGDDFKKIPRGAIGVYTYLTDRVGTGLRQLLAGLRKWKLNLLSRDDIVALTERASRVTGVPTVDELEAETFEQILSD